MKTKKIMTMVMAKAMTAMKTTTIMTTAIVKAMEMMLCSVHGAGGGWRDRIGVRRDSVEVLTKNRSQL